VEAIMAKRQQSKGKAKGPNGELVPQSPPGMPKVRQLDASLPVDPQKQWEQIREKSRGLFRGQDEVEEFVADIYKERRRSREN